MWLNTVEHSAGSIREIPRKRHPTMSDLRLAGAGDGTIRASCRSGSGSVRLGLAVGLGTGSRGHLVSRHVNNGLLASVAAGTASLGGLVVGDNVEGDEQNEVRRENAHSSESGEFLSGTVAHVGSPREVSRGEVGIRREVDED